MVTPSRSNVTHEGQPGTNSSASYLESMPDALFQVLLPWLDMKSAVCLALSSSRTLATAQGHALDLTGQLDCQSVEELMESFPERSIGRSWELGGLPFRMESVEDLLLLGTWLGAKAVHLGALRLRLPPALGRVALDVTGLPSLHTAHMGFNHYAESVAFAGASSLRRLDLGGCLNLNDVSGLSSLSALQTLDLHTCPQLIDVSALGELSNLTSLSLSYCSRIVDVSPLGRLPNLTTLSLAACKSVKDVSGLRSLGKLHTLYLSDCSHVETLAGFESLSCLHTLYLSDCSMLRDLSALKGASELHSLTLQRCVNLEDISSLFNHPGLRSLDLRGCFRLTGRPELLKCLHPDCVVHA